VCESAAQDSGGCGSSYMGARGGGWDVRQAILSSIMPFSPRESPNATRVPLLARPGARLSVRNAALRTWFALATKNYESPPRDARARASSGSRAWSGLYTAFSVHCGLLRGGLSISSRAYSRLGLHGRCILGAGPARDHGSACRPGFPPCTAAASGGSSLVESRHRESSRSQVGQPPSGG